MLEWTVSIKVAAEIRKL